MSLTEPSNRSPKTELVATAAADGSGQFRVVLRRFLRHRTGIVALGVLALLVVVAIVVPPLWPYAAGQITPDLSASPSLQHPMGTDQLGRDQFAQVLRGLQQSLLIAFSVTVVATVIGTVLGVVAGYLGAAVDAAIMRLVDLTLTLPTLAIAAFLGSVVPAGGVSWFALSLVLGVLMWTSMARLVRGVVLGLRALPYVDAARTMGAGSLRVMFRHLIPNVADHIIVAATLLFGASILAETGLSFLGFGVQPPDTSLGRLVADAQSAVLTRPWLFYFPGLLIILLVLSVNYIGEGLRDAVNPKSAPVNPLDARPMGGARRRTRRGATPRASAPPETGRLVEIRDFSVEFSGRAVVDRISLDLAPGSVTALVGESGSGKTLTALSLVGLLPPTAVASGELRFDGIDLMELRFEQWRRLRGRRIAMVLQDPSTSLNPVLTIGRQFADQLRMSGITGAALDERATALLTGVSIKDPARVLASYPHQLSGGMRQRVVIAMAMAMDPDLIIADEPTTALDVTVQAQVMKTLAAARERTGASMLFITHDLALVAGIADRVVVMQAGRIVESGDVQDIFTAPAHEYTRKLLSLAPDLSRHGAIEEA
ncbi:dipeptide/oligopeptide/nickel ABC transporter permease/ATP-binding protein [Microbacterium resistens]|uniref:dipeptide/oligopeptide/nickel ABC transporter permease/ATP-binding protein n=1 Tax=Microbacterium resistens TaxID=156977 RepID=UPI0008366C2C|nr:dipeptide/oligopeptide/nickel ABC transporter permease/ATP-binding protein [Microbacterium resistens]